MKSKRISFIAAVLIAIITAAGLKAAVHHRAGTNCTNHHYQMHDCR